MVCVQAHINIKRSRVANIFYRVWHRISCALRYGHLQSKAYIYKARLYDLCFRSECEMQLVLNTIARFMHIKIVGI